jgi:transaldolase
VSDLTNLNVKIFADGANLKEMISLSKTNYVKGLTTNPTLLRKARITDYENFARKALEQISEIPISFEVFSDDFKGMVTQGERIASWAPNVYVKIPITNTKGVVASSAVKALTEQGIKVNVTAVMTSAQVDIILNSLSPELPSFISVFAGRIADTGVDPMPIMKSSLDLIKSYRCAELIWASPRELLNVFQANEIGCHIITVTPEILNKFHLIDFNLDSYSLETVKMFYTDAQASGLHLS